MTFRFHMHYIILCTVQGRREVVVSASINVTLHDDAKDGEFVL